MAGLVAVLGLPGDVAEPAARRALAALRRRGPDGEHLAVVPCPHGGTPVVLGHARLAAGTAPGEAEPLARPPAGDPHAPPRWVAHDGALLGAAALREALGGRAPGGPLAEGELLLAAWGAWGEEAAERLRGPLAVVVADPAAQRVWLVRDRLGVTPLWLFRPAGGGLLVASDVRALLACGPDLVPPRLDPAALEGYLAQGCVYGRGALVRGVELLEAGTSLVVDWRGAIVTARSYWRAPFAPAGAAGSPAERRRVVERLEVTLRQAVRLRLDAVGPVGLLLSGGVDAAAVAAVATEVAGGELRSVCVAPEGAGDDAEGVALDESAAAEATAQVLGTRHVTVRVGGADLAHALAVALDEADQPSCSGLAATLAARAARDVGLAVALGGLGGDEVFGGFPSFRDVPRAVRGRSLSRVLDRFERVAPFAVRALGGRGGGAGGEARGREPDLLELYLQRREVFLPGERRALHGAPPGCDPITGIPDDVAAALRALARGLDPFNRIAAFELGGHLRHLLLRDADAAAAAAGIELRAPLLDHELVELAAACPGAWRLRDPRPKPLLQDAVGPRLPFGVRRAVKRGLSLPLEAWLRGPLRPLALEALHAREAWADLGVSHAAPLDLWRRFEAGDTTVAGVQVLALVALSRWARRSGVSR